MVVSKVLSQQKDGDVAIKISIVANYKASYFLFSNLINVREDCFNGCHINWNRGCVKRSERGCFFFVS
jgi:hypothetical protein